MNKKRWLGVGIAVVLLVISLVVPNYQREKASWNKELDSITSGFISQSEELQEIVIEPGDGQNRILHLDLDGTIMAGGSSSMFAPAVYNHDFFLAQLDEVLEDDTIKAIYFTINTPGGGVYESAEIRNRILKIKEERNIPIYVSMLNMAASGGYYIAADATKIYATEETWTGSIGVISQVMDFGGLLERYGIKVHTYASGDMKTMGSPYKAPTEEEVAIWNELTKEAYDKFVALVANGRGLSEQEVRTLADGRIYTGKQALENGLVDELAYKEEVLEGLKTENSLENAQVFKYSMGNNQFFNIFNQLSSFNKNDSELAVLKALLEKQLTSAPTPYYLYGGK